MGRRQKERKKHLSNLYTNCRDGNEIEVEQLLASVEKVPEGLISPLQIACKQGHLHIVKLLLAYGADILLKGDAGRRFPFFLAAENGHLELVKLLSATADVNARESDTMMPLHAASAKGHLEVVKFLCQLGANINEACDNGDTPLVLAAEHGRPHVVTFLLEAGARLDAGSGAALYEAAHLGHLEVVQLLLNHGANINERVYPHKTAPLFIASENKHVEVVKLLLENGADATLPNAMGVLPLLLPCHRGGREIVQLLLDHGANPNGPYPTNSGDQLLETVFGRAYIECWLYWRDSWLVMLNSTCLHTVIWGAWRGMENITQEQAYEILKILLKHGANVNSIQKSSIRFMKYPNEFSLMCD